MYMLGVRNASSGKMIKCRRVRIAVTLTVLALIAIAWLCVSTKEGRSSSLTELVESTKRLDLLETFPSTSQVFWQERHIPRWRFEIYGEVTNYQEFEAWMAIQKVASYGRYDSPTIVRTSLQPKDRRSSVVALRDDRDGCYDSFEPETL